MEYEKYDVFHPKLFYATFLTLNVIYLVSRKYLTSYFVGRYIKNLISISQIGLIP